MIIWPHSNNLENAGIAKDYPYGFNRRCEMAFFVEHRDNKGWRAVTQSKNPKTDEWNKAHAGTYSAWPIFVISDDKGEFFEFSYCPNPMWEPDEFLAWFGTFGECFQNNHFVDYWGAYATLALEDESFQKLESRNKKARILDRIKEWRKDTAYTY